MDQPSRPPPPAIAPIVIDGIRYSQVTNARKLGLQDSCGWLMATDEMSGEMKWTQQIYATTYSPEDEEDVQEIYFRSMKPVEGRRAIEIRNEAGRRFILDLDTRKVTETAP